MSRPIIELLLAPGGRLIDLRFAALPRLRTRGHRSVVRCHSLFQRRQVRFVGRADRCLLFAEALAPLRQLRQLPIRAALLAGRRGDRLFGERCVRLRRGDRIPRRAIRLFEERHLGLVRVDARLRFLELLRYVHDRLHKVGGTLAKLGLLVEPHLAGRDQ